MTPASSRRLTKIGQPAAPKALAARFRLVDTLLAATALTHGLVMVARNLRYFEHVPGLTIENWFESGVT